MKPSRTVTRPRCVTCERKFISRRADARYCSGRCRQRANRARRTSADIDRAIDDARRLYWSLVRRKAEAQGVTVSQVLTGEAHTVDDDGNVFMRGRHFGTTTPGRPGWTRWGLEAAGKPFTPPGLEKLPENFAQDRIEKPVTDNGFPGMDNLSVDAFLAFMASATKGFDDV